MALLDCFAVDSKIAFQSVSLSCLPNVASTRLQIYVKFLRVASEKIGLVEEGLEARGRDEEASQLAGIEISLDGRTVLSSNGDFASGDGIQPPGISNYFLDPRDVTLNVTIDQATDTLIEMNHEGIDGFVTAEDEGALSADSGCKAEDDDKSSAAGSYSLSVAALMERRRERLQESDEVKKGTNKITDVALQTAPLSLIRLGSRFTADYGVPRAWPPMTDYKCGIIYAEMTETEGETAKNFRLNVVLMDGDDNVGIAFRHLYSYEKYTSLDYFLIWYLGEKAKEWLMQRPLIIVADSWRGNNPIPRKSGCIAPLEQCIATKLSYFREWLHICRDPILAKMFMSLVFC